MIEERKKIGLVVPSSNTSTEPDFYRVMPANVSLHSHRIWLEDTTLEDLDTMNRDAEKAARYIGTADVDVIAYACTSGSSLGGPGYDQNLLVTLTKASGGAPAIGTSPAMIDGLKSLGIKRVSVVTPYLDSINERLQAFLEGHGFEVISIAGQQIVPNTEIGAQTPETILAFANKHLDPSADGYFLSCTNWRAFEVVEQLEQQSGKPVVTSNQATIWAAFRSLGLHDPIPGFGALLRQPAS
ncbi:MAG: aspartate/glutamate racemase family protein [Chloroflexi bacterium]|nr:aspartate/glutamate racemase family protein [Chloroflexota bacterium]